VAASITIPSRFNGPPGSANGGYTCGLVASAAPWPQTEVTLRTPPPLSVPLAVSYADDLLRLTSPDGTLVAEARATLAPADTVAPVSRAEAVAASAHYPGFTNHPFPTCYVCGHERPQRDGLAIYPGRLDDGRTAAPFTAPDTVTAAVVWAALDCPGGWAVPLEGRPYVLGRCAAQVDALPAPGDECVVMGAVVGEDGRKAFTLTTLYGPSGTVLATARATWIAL
jgi:hypothetical protein